MRKTGWNCTAVPYDQSTFTSSTSSQYSRSPRGGDSVSKNLRVHSDRPFHRRLQGTLDNYADDYCSWSGIECDADLNVINMHLASFDLEGTIPSSIADLSKLETLDLRSNSLTGSIPNEFSRLSNLNLFDVSFNLLEGGLEEFSKMINPSISYFSVRGNFLNGTVPKYMGNFDKLTSLHLENNLFSGKMPETLCTIAETSAVDISGNTMTCYEPCWADAPRFKSGDIPLCAPTSVPTSIPTGTPCYDHTSRDLKCSSVLIMNSYRKKNMQPQNCYIEIEILFI
jgi:hypothetical protein